MVYIKFSGTFINKTICFL
jgi:hypothetical protein